jgi:beta-glucanase (GH16 family)
MTRSVFALATLAGLGCATHAQTLVWSDEFNTLNTTVWQPMIGDGSDYGIPGWGNNEAQYYTGRSQNVRVENGELVIEARRENFGGKEYTSARLRTINQVDILYGRIEARMKIPATQGIWPAFWMLPTNSPYGGWPMSGEIDIMESINNADRLHGTLHFGNPWPQNSSAGRSTTNGAPFSSQYRVYRVDWYPNRFEWAVDGVVYGVIYQNNWFTPESTAPGAPFDQPFHMLLNVAVGGNWPGYPNASSVFPQQMRVDWVRVYDLGDGPSQEPFTGTPAVVPGRIEAENYDLGGQGLAYNDQEPANQGGQYRPTEGVDIQARAGGGFNVGWIRQGEWIEYTINHTSPVAKRYTLTADVASLSSGGSFRLAFSIEGNETESVDFTVPATGGWQTWTTVTREVELQPGEQVMRFTNLSGSSQEFNIDGLTFDPIECAGDIADSFGTLGADSDVNFGDFLALLGLIGPCPGGISGCTGDLADDLGTVGMLDGQVSFGDFLAMLGLIGPCQ